MVVSKFRLDLSTLWRISFIFHPQWVSAASLPQALDRDFSSRD